MAKFPVDISDKEGIVDAVNYTLSGPAGLGQNFQGFSSATIPYGSTSPPLNETAYLTGNFRTPFVNKDPNTKTYVAPIELSVSQYIDARTIKFTFAETQPAPPFALGNPLEVIGVTSTPIPNTNPPKSPYDGVQRPTGVIECTTEYVICRVNGDGKTYANGYGGTISFNAFGGYAFVSTDCSAKVVVNSATDRVFISAQLNNLLSYTATETSTLTYTVMVNRRSGFTNNDPINPDFLFGNVETISVKNYYMQVDAGTGTLPPAPFASWQVSAWPLETIFTAIIDTPPVGYYWYIIDIEVDTTQGDAVITQSELTNRSISVQVVKQ